MYEGRTGAEAGIVFGHENMGIVEEVGSGVVSPSLPLISSRFDRISL
jgi:glutathione-independent formaldehyde dehydrogenase